MDKIFSDDFLEEARTTGIELHRTLNLLKKTIGKCALLEERLSTHNRIVAKHVNSDG